MTALCYESIEWSPFVTDVPVDLAAQIRAAAEAGFDGFSVDIWSLRSHLEHGGTVHEVAERLEASGLRCLEVQALVVTEDTEETRRAAHEMAEIADVLAPEIIMSGFPGEPTEQAVANYSEALGILPAGTPVGLEFLPTLAINDIATALRVVRASGASRAGVVLDAWHFFHGPSTWEDLDAMALEDIAFVQFSDHPALESDDLTTEMMQRRVFPGDGILDLHRFASTLRAKGFDGVVGVEVISEPLRALGYDEFARRAYQAAVPYWR